jgi:hypothetical protein
MASFVLICDIVDKNSATSWEKTPYKCLAARIAGTGATEEPIHRDSRPALTRSCYKLPDGWQVTSDALAEETMVEHCEWDRALDSVRDYVTDESNPMRWRAKALGDAVKAERAKRNKR